MEEWAKDFLAKCAATAERMRAEGQRILDKFERSGLRERLEVLTKTPG